MNLRFGMMALLLYATAAVAQESGYQFTDVASVPATPVKNQAATGTCWCLETIIL